MTRIVYANRELIVTLFVISACLALASFFPVQGLFQSLAGLASFFVLIPWLYVQIILKKDLADFGFQIGDWRKGLWGILIAAIFSVPVIHILINYAGLLDKQGILKNFQGNFWGFLYFETVFPVLLAIIFEIFFRGFVMLGTVEKFGRWSIGIQFLLSLLLLWILKLFPWGISCYIIIGSLFSGIIAYRSRSLIYGVVFNWLLILVADTLVIKLLK